MLIKYNTFAKSFTKIRAVSSSSYIFWSLSFISAWCAVLLFTHAQHLVTLTHPRSEPDPNIEHGDADTLCWRVKWDYFSCLRHSLCYKPPSALFPQSFSVNTPMKMKQTIKVDLLSKYELFVLSFLSYRVISVSIWRCGLHMSKEELHLLSWYLCKKDLLFSFIC